MANFGNGFWIVQNEGGWVPNPENLSTGDFGTEGLEHWVAEYGSVEHAPKFTPDYEDIMGWTTIDISMEEGHDIVKVSGTYQGATLTITMAKEDALQEIFRRHSDLSDTSIYFVLRRAANLFKKFPDDDRVMQKYLKCRFSAAPKTKVSKRVLEFSFTLRSMW